MAFDRLDGHGCCLFTTYRRSGAAIGTPVWFALDGDGVLICTDDPSGKVKRIRSNPDVAIAPCTFRGRRLGPDETGRATVLIGDDADRAAQVMRRSYSLARRAFYKVIHPLVARDKSMVFVRVAPHAPERSIAGAA